MKLATLLFVLAVGSSPLVAQNAPAMKLGVVRTVRPSAPYVAASARFQVSHGCPVSMRLNQQVNAALHQAGKGQTVPVLAASLHLEISDALNGKEKTASVKAAKVTVLGYDGTPSLELVSPSPSLPARTMNIQFVPVAGDGASADFSVRGIVSASQLRIDSLTYASGATWIPARGESCIVSPDPFMLVGSHWDAGAAQR